MKNYLSAQLKMHDKQSILTNNKELENKILYIQCKNIFYFIPEYINDEEENIIIYCEEMIYTYLKKEMVKVYFYDESIKEESLIILKNNTLLPNRYILNSFLNQYIYSFCNDCQFLITDLTEKIYLNDDEILILKKLCNFFKFYAKDLDYKNILIIKYREEILFFKLLKILCKKYCINFEENFKNNFLKINAKNYLIFKKEINFYIKHLTEKFSNNIEQTEIFNKICGYEEIKKKLENILFLPKNFKEKFLELKINRTKNLILYGPAGCGKSLFAKAIANKLNVHIIEVKASSLISKWMGETERNIEQVFFEAQINSPSIIIIDNFESFAYNSVYIHDIRMINTFLLEMDKVKNNHEIFIVGITQQKQNISHLFLSSGRFDEFIHIKLPDYETRQELFKKFLLPVKFEDFEIMNFANISNEFSCADIKYIVNKGKENALVRGGESCEVLVSDIINAIEELSRRIFF